MKCILIRADASIIIGTGHIMRCLTLADEFARNNFETIFVCREEPGNLISYISEKRNFRVEIIPHTKPSTCNSLTEGNTFEFQLEDAESVMEIIRNKNLNVDLILVDHYALDNLWESKLRLYIGKIMVIDDLANRKHDCDLLLDQNITENPEKYRSLIPQYATTLIGPRFSLLRDQFKQFREKGVKVISKLDIILIFFGGVDRTNQTEKALRAISELADIRITTNAIIGENNQNRQALTELVANIPNTNLYINVENMAEFMLNADLSIGACGTAIWERCCLGLPSIVITTAENQEKVAQALAKELYIEYLGNHEAVSSSDIKNAIERLGTGNKLQNIRDRCMKLVDAKGTERVMVAIHQLLQTNALKIREVNEKDLATLFHWVNEEAVRDNSFSTTAISLAEHAKWFYKKLTDSQVYMYILEYHDKPVGQVRFDVEDGMAEIDYSIDFQYRNLGLGTAILDLGIKAFTADVDNQIVVQGKVKSYNTASIDAFKKNHFKIVTTSATSDSMTFYKATTNEN